ncbi:hypothetical protein BC835DRAFT_1421155 [Cytidiella melzeri]|nr:hypothetical protein BC835DRAFT_1421155 [Cytidiella melzeri]
MTSTPSSSPSGSPRWDSHWDNRNSGFVSPSQLQQWKQQQALHQQQLQEQQRLLQQQQQESSTPSAHVHPVHAPRQPQPPLSRTTSRQDQPMATSPSTATHARTSSAFSFFKRPSHNASLSNASIKELQRQSNVPNEFGQHPATPSSVSQPPPTDKTSPPLPSAQSSQEPIPESPQRMSTDDVERMNAAPPPNSNAPPAEAPLPPLHPEIRSIVQLNVAHGQKIYFSGPLIRRMERQADGQRPTKDEGWREVWAQLGGTTLSLWDMKAIEEASKQGKQVPPSYVNVTDAFLQVLGSVTIPATASSPAKKYTNVLTLNNAGSNLYLFSCPTTQALLSWTAALRLAAWEKARLEEIYTAHLLRITLNDGRDVPTPLVHGRLEGWVRIRVAGQTDWKRLWMVVAAGSNLSESGSIASADHGPSTLKKKRISSIFSGSRDDPPLSRGTPTKPIIQLFQSNKPKDKKKSMLVVREVRQAFAVYPERPEFISRSTLFKLEGLLGDEELAATFKGREGWLLVMPELEGINTRASEMLKWLTGIHDAFELYGRPRLYSWDPRDPRSMMFAYPIGPHKDMLFLDRELAENLDPRDDRTSSARSQLLHIMWDRMRGSPEQSHSPPVAERADGPPILPPLGENAPEGRFSPTLGESQPASSSQAMQIPPLSFETSRTDHDLPAVPARVLTPITERSADRNSRFSGTEYANGVVSSRSGTSPPADQHAEVRPTDDSKASVNGLTRASNSIETNPSSPHSPTVTTQPSIYSSAELVDSRAQEDVRSFGGLPPSKPETSTSFPRQTTSTQYDDVTAVNAPRSSQSGRQSPAFGLDQRPPSASRPPAPVSRGTSESIRSSLDKPIQPVPHRYAALNAPQSSNEIMQPTSPHSSSLSHPQPLSETMPSSPRFSVLTSPHSFEEPPGDQPSASRLSVALQDIPPHTAPKQSLNSPILSTHPALPRDMSRPGASPRVDAAVPAIATREATSSSQLTVPSTVAWKTSAPPVAVRQASPAIGPSPPPPPKDSNTDISREAGALYYMRNIEQVNKPRAQLPPSPGGESESESESGSAYSPLPTENRRAAVSPISTNSANSPDTTISTTGGYFTPRASVAYSSPLLSQSGPTRGTPGRRPSGARAAPVSQTHAPAQRDRQPPLPPPQDVDEDDEQISEEQYSEETGRVPHQLPPRMAAAAQHDDAEAADALAALSFLAREELTQPQPEMPSQVYSPTSPPQQPAAETRDTSSPASHEGPMRSTFAKSKAAQRKAQSDAQKAAQHAAAHVPGRANGKGKKKMQDAGAWGESSDEEEEEEDDDDDEDADSDEEPPQKQAGKVDRRQPGQAGQDSYFPPRSASPMAPPPEQNGYPASARRFPRDLPQLPQGSSQSQLGASEYLGPQSQRFVSDQYSEAGRRSLYPEAPRRQPSPQTQMRQPDYNNVGAARQNMWSQALERDTSAAAPEPTRDTFVQLEPPSQTMTKAFAPHGLLSAGLQDKQDRSAKRQEELARETGASLINVPHKPPPPQTGLLGAVTAHERERKREGGLGATLTEREREKRLAEERQRKLDEYQRMQLDQMQQGGSMYGGMGMQPQFSGYNPMMANPMMMGMNPMMTGGYMGYPGMMNTPHMFAAQQAAQAYQQAMYAFSTAGSQVGGDTGSPGAALNPMMTGGMGFDPRMSMMGMGMMSPSMTGMGQSMITPGVSSMGMGMGMMGGMGMNPQMTGASAFDARFTPSNEALHPPNEIGGPSRPYSQNSSANVQGGIRPLEGGEEPPRRGGAELR